MIISVNPWSGQMCDVTIESADVLPTIDYKTFFFFFFCPGNSSTSFLLFIRNIISSSVSIVLINELRRLWWWNVINCERQYWHRERRKLDGGRPTTREKPVGRFGIVQRWRGKCLPTISISRFFSFFLFWLRVFVLWKNYDNNNFSRRSILKKKKKSSNTCYWRSFSSRHRNLKFPTTHLMSKRLNLVDVKTITRTTWINYCQSSTKTLCV